MSWLDVFYPSCEKSSIYSTLRLSRVSTCSDNRISFVRKFTITPYVGNVLCTVIDDAIDQLYCLGAGMVPTTAIQIDDLEERAKQYIADDPTFDPETGYPFEVYLYNKERMKIHSDSSKIADFLTMLRLELKNKRNFTCLSNFLEKMKKSKIMDDMQLFSDEKKNLTEMKNLKETLRTEQRVCQENMSSKNAEIANLIDQAQHESFDCVVHNRHVHNMENARIEQNNLLCSQKMNKIKTELVKYKNEMITHRRVHKEINSFIAVNQRDMEKEIKEWMERYDKESENRILEIALVKENREDLTVKSATLNKLYALRQKEIDDYLVFREQKRLDAERMVFLGYNATKVQAWWRGLMVRRQLGRFRPKKAKGKKKK